MRRLRAEEHNVSPIHISHHASGRRGRLGERHAHWHAASSAGRSLITRAFGLSNSERKMTPKMLPSLLMAAGSLMLAWRVKSLLDVLILAQLGSETNFRSITEFLTGRQSELPVLVGFDQHVSRRRQLGVWLLVVGFLLIGASGLLNVYLLWSGL